MKKEYPSVSVVCVFNLEGIVLVKNNKKQDPVWKIPGGKGKNGEFKEQTASRELWKETGLVVDGADLNQCYSEDRRTHDFLGWYANCPKLRVQDLNSCLAREVKIFTIDEVKKLIKNRQFLQSHIKCLGAAIKAR